MENKRSYWRINNKNVKQLLENDYLLIHCLLTFESQMSPMRDEKF